MPRKDLILGVYLQYLEFLNGEDVCKNTRSQRGLQNFSPVQVGLKLPVQKTGGWSLAKTLTLTVQYHRAEKEKIGLSPTMSSSMQGIHIETLAGQRHRWAWHGWARDWYARGPGFDSGRTTLSWGVS